MTERLAGFMVTLDKDIREDDAKSIIDAIKMIKHVQDVKPITATPELDLAQNRVRQELGQKILKVIYPDFKGG